MDIVSRKILSLLLLTKINLGITYDNHLIFLLLSCCKDTNFCWFLNTYG